MELTYCVDLEAELVSELGLLDHVAQPLSRRHAWIGDLSKCGQSKLHGCVILPTRRFTDTVGVG